VAYLLTLPTQKVAYSTNILLQRYPIDEGLALLITGVSGVLVSFPDQLSIDEADYYFGGGRETFLTNEEYNAVVAAGFGEYVTIV
jgi:hypothetical protein